MSDHNERSCRHCGSLLHHEDDCLSKNAFDSLRAQLAEAVDSAAYHKSNSDGARLMMESARRDYYDARASLSRALDELRDARKALADLLRCYSECFSEQDEKAARATLDGMPHDQGDQSCQAVAGNGEGEVPTSAPVSPATPPSGNLAGRGGDEVDKSVFTCSECGTQLDDAGVCWECRINREIDSPIVIAALKEAYANGHQCDLADRCPGCMAGYALEAITGRKWTQEECDAAAPQPAADAEHQDSSRCADDRSRSDTPLT